MWIIDTAPKGMDHPGAAGPHRPDLGTILQILPSKHVASQMDKRRIDGIRLAKSAWQAER
ncbi:hypothetical protein C5L14_26860 [Labrys okinawensis]|uniref:Uncharacterized protein n=1 Tax=Labrys okinawensis TaxID=346911 RepID=A0A2S9Q533_9HYPH|nr:hypothetical protein C5L14_26860 [Labrys okinawensis]